MMAPRIPLLVLRAVVRPASLTPRSTPRTFAGTLGAPTVAPTTHAHQHAHARPLGVQTTEHDTDDDGATEVRRAHLVLIRYPNLRSIPTRNAR